MFSSGEACDPDGLREVVKDAEDAYLDAVVADALNQKSEQSMRKALQELTELVSKEDKWQYEYVRGVLGDGYYRERWWWLDDQEQKCSYLQRVEPYYTAAQKILRRIDSMSDDWSHATFSNGYDSYTAKQIDEKMRHADDCNR